eukprot:7267731-Pyramimonas_sp.AAC.2
MLHEKMQYHSMQHDTVQYAAIQYKTIQLNTIQCIAKEPSSTQRPRATMPQDALTAPEWRSGPKAPQYALDAPRRLRPHTCT